MKLSISNKEIIRLAAPISLSLLLPQVTFLTDTAFLGRLGERELAVNGIAGIFYLILSMVGQGLSIGIQVQMSRRAGEGDHKALGRTYTNGMMLCFGLSMVLMLSALVFAPILFSNTLSSAENIEKTISFLNIRVLGLPFLILNQLANAFYIAIGRSRYLIYGSLVSMLVNIVLDYGLIFGHLGMPEMGLEGAALATIIAEALACITMFALFYINKLQHTYPVFSSGKFDFVLAKRSLVISSPLIAQFLFSMGGWQIFFIYVEHLGTSELAASQILRSVFGLAGIGLWALASTCNTIVSNVIGQGKQRLVIPAIVRVIKIAVIYAAVLAAILIVFSDSFLALYRNDADLIALAKPSLRVVAVSSILMAISTVLFNGVAGTGNTQANLLIEVTCVCSYVLYCYIVIQRLQLSLTWAWVSEFVYWGTLFIASSLYLRSGRWKGKTV